MDRERDLAKPGPEVHEDILARDGHVEHRAHDGRDATRRVIDRVRVRSRRRGWQVPDPQEPLDRGVSLGGRVRREPCDEVRSAKR